MKVFKKITLAMACSFAAIIWSPAMAAEYEISVEIDAATAGDLELVESSLDGLADDTEAVRSVRRLMNNIGSDLIDMSSDRLDDEGNLTMDDGSVVYIVEGDEIIIKPKRLDRAYPRMYMCGFRDNRPGKTKRTHRRPCVFVLKRVDGSYIKQPIPAGRGCRGPNPNSLHMMCRR